MAVAEKLKRPFTFTDVMNQTDGYTRKEIRRVLSALSDEERAQEPERKRLIDLGKENRQGGAVRYQLPDGDGGQADDLEQIRNPKLREELRQQERQLKLLKK